MVVVVVVDLSRVFHVIDSATLQLTHRCTPAPDGMLAVPAALPTVSSVAVPIPVRSYLSFFVSTLPLMTKKESLLGTSRI